MISNPPPEGLNRLGFAPETRGGKAAGNADSPKSRVMGADEASEAGKAASRSFAGLSASGEDPQNLTFPKTPVK